MALQIMLCRLVETTPTPPSHGPLSEAFSQQNVTYASLGGGKQALNGVA